jgi:sugar O-acyltransferase (sialic acid O-acetyltransferase NeuD family)
MPIDVLALLGGGGHAKVVYDAARLAGIALQFEVRDDDLLRQGSAFLDRRIIGPIEPLEALPTHVHVAIGENAVRAHLAERLRACGRRLVTIVHPKAVVADAARIDRGAFIAAGAVIAPGAAVGECAIINHGCIVDHECVVEPFAHVAPNATLGGAVRVGSGALIGAGAVVLPGVTVGADAIVGAGAVVTRAVSTGEAVIGVPARPARNV